MRKYVTISVPADVKRVLERAKGKREWGEFLLSLYVKAERLRAKGAFKELISILTSKDLENILELLESSREFKERLTLR